MKTEDIINEVDLKDAKRIIIFVEKKDGGQIAQWEDPHSFSVSTAGTRRDMKVFVRHMLAILHSWLMADIPDYPLRSEPSKTKKKTK